MEKSDKEVDHSEQDSTPCYEVVPTVDRCDSICSESDDGADENPQG
jgi:hypothetical protein